MFRSPPAAIYRPVCALRSRLEADCLVDDFIKDVVSIEQPQKKTPDSLRVRSLNQV
jgi:hypothetical protein